MIKITDASTYLQSIDVLRRQQSTGVKTSSAEKNLLNSISPANAEKADALEKRLEETKQAAAQLRTIGKSMGQSKKADAAERVKRIKEQIKMLKMSGGDPKMIARQIAQLARELSSAVKEYAGGGTPSLDSAMPENAGTGVEVENSATFLSADQNSAGNDLTATSADVSTTTVSRETATSEDADQNTEDAGSIVSTESTSETRTASTRQHEETARQKQNDALQEKIVGIRQMSSDATATREFIQEVRMLAAQLKALANQQKQRLHQNGEQTADQDLEHINQALAEVEKNVSDLATGGTAPAITISTFV